MRESWNSEDGWHSCCIVRFHRCSMICKPRVFTNLIWCPTSHSWGCLQTWAICVVFTGASFWYVSSSIKKGKKTQQMKWFLLAWLIALKCYFCNTEVNFLILTGWKVRNIQIIGILKSGICFSVKNKKKPPKPKTNVAFDFFFYYV